MVRDCTACVTSSKTGPPLPPPLQPLPRFLLVAYDLHSKWPEVLPAGSVTTKVVIGFLSSLFARWGVPNVITMDNGPQFISANFTAFMTGRGVKHIRTALYHP